MARLAFTDDELVELQNGLTSILTHMDALAEVDTSNIPPMTRVSAQEGFLRQDVVQASLPRTSFLPASAQSDDEHFVVPSVLPKGAS